MEDDQPMLFYVWIQTLVCRAHRRHQCSQAGQASAEYALVLLGAAAVALLVVAWATRTDAVGRLLDGVMDQILKRIR